MPFAGVYVEFNGEIAVYAEMLERLRFGNRHKVIRLSMRNEYPEGGCAADFGSWRHSSTIFAGCCDFTASERKRNA